MQQFDVGDGPLGVIKETGEECSQRAIDTLLVVNSDIKLLTHHADPPACETDGLRLDLDAGLVGYFDGL